MKVHIVINDVSRSGGGAQKVALELQAGVLGRGVSSTLVALESLDRSAPLEPGLRSLNCSVRRPVSALVALVRYFRSEVRDGDVIHVHLFPSLLLVPMAQRLARRSCRLVMTEHNTVNGRRGRWIGRLVDSLIYPRYDAIVCISEGTREALEAWMPAQGSRASVVTNGVGLPFAEPVRRSDPRPFVILSLGRLVEQKDYSTALAAISELSDLDLEYRIAGSGPLFGALEREAERLGVRERVRFLGYRSDVEALLESADAFLLTSAWEGFGLVAVEAMNAGLPVICSDVPGLREVVGEGGDCALLVRPGDFSGFARALRRVVGDEELRRRLGRQGFARSQRFGVDRMVDGYLEAYALSPGRVAEDAVRG